MLPLTSRSLQLRAGAGRSRRREEARVGVLVVRDRPPPSLASRRPSPPRLGAYDWSKSGANGGAGVVPATATTPTPTNRPYRRFAASEDSGAVDALLGVVGRALATDPVTLAYALPGKEQRYCEAALRAGLLTDSVGRDRRLWLSECGRAAAVAYLCIGASSSSNPRPPPLPLLAGAQRAALTAQALTSLRPGEPARACARAATALARVRGAYCAAVERSVGTTTTTSPPAALVAYVSVLAVDPPVQGQGLGTRLLRHVLRELLAGAIDGDGGGRGGGRGGGGEGGGEDDTAMATKTTTPPRVAAAHAYVEASSERSAKLYERLGFRVIAVVDADGAVRASGGGGWGGGEEGEDEDEGGGDGGGGGGSSSSYSYSLPRAPTMVMAAELKGRFREWLAGEDEGGEES